jgi:hypothetical protein
VLGCGSPRDDADVLVPFGARWRVADAVEGAPAVWAAAGFADDGWLEGAAPLGFGEGDEAFLLPRSFASADDDPITFVRHGFRVDDPSAIEALRIRIVHDDGAVVFLNGVELFRSNMRSLPLDPQLPSATPLGPATERDILEFRPGAEALLKGQNVIAAQVHQHWRDRGDLRFDLELAAVTARQPLRVLRGPWLQRATPESMTIRWRTNRPSPSRVRFGLSPEALDRSAESGGAPTTEHEVVIRGLAPLTRYAYAVDAEGGVLAGGDGAHTFRTPPRVGSDEPVRVWVTGDSGTGGQAARDVRDAFIRHAGERPPDVWLLLGDNAYPSGSDADHKRGLFDNYTDLLRRTPIWPVLGNHGANLTDTREGYGPFLEIFGEPFYAFDHGNVRFVAIDSAGSDWDPDDPMMRFLPAALRPPDADWVVAYLHHPAISGGTHDLEAGRRTRRFWEALLPVLEAADVDLVLAGHSHAYERSFLLGPSQGGLATLGEAVLDAGDGDPDGDGAYTKSDRGTVWVIAGSAATVGDEGDLDHPAMAVSLRQLGSLVLDIEGCRLDGRFVDARARTRDHFVIDKCAGAASGN